SKISAQLVKELRERTGAGMMECKKALVAALGDIEKAAEEMRISGQAKADKKASRVTAEGIVEAYAENGTAVLLEINSETDFVARDDSFKTFCRAAAKAAHDAGAKTIEEVLVAKMENGETVESARQNLVSKIGENIQVRRIKTVSAPILGAYIHGGKIGVVAALEGGDTDLAKDISMHIAAVNPMVVSGDEVPADFLDEVALLGQSFVKDPSITVENLLKQKSAKVISFIRLDVGEGIEKKEE
ncbi:hypothetical protein EGW08_023084, partial [Elysia chlorotica]